MDNDKKKIISSQIANINTIPVLDNSYLKDFQNEKDIVSLEAAIDEYGIEIWPECRECEEFMIYPNTKLVQMTGNRKFLRTTGSHVATKIVNNVEYKNSMCHECLLKRLPAKKALKKNLFNAFGEAVRIAFDIPQEEIDSVNKTRAVTIKTMTAKYGEEEGLKRYNAYCKKQGDKNKFEYKQEHKGWTREQFDEFNLSRACTKENFISRHGEEAGSKMWDDYCKIQSETSSNEYYLEHRPERFDYISEARNKTLKWCIAKYGEENGTRLYEEVYQNRGVSRKSIKFFDNVMSIVNIGFPEIKAIFGNDEIVVHSRKFDFCIEEINLLVEYHGTLWHAKPSKYGHKKYRHPLDSTITKERIWARDAAKANIAKEANYELHIVWSDEEQAMLPIITKRIIELLQQKIKK